MNEPLQKWWERLQFTLLFIVLTVLVHHLYGWMQTIMTPIDPYKVPEGRATKVFQAGDAESGTVTPGDRLKLFYWLGE
ncbi:DUF4227 family protein [Cohnella nanjingensis]|uniref:YqzK family protein n=1 Tax=Cohnella nanjingensis TaxID=1387779 RepID=A0A7X0VJ02_9BACL|nr:DUF4227 family protein [Cohnella nanjingensis]MBB6674214.1 YqzK family protein [Cohnella nanjingensis]